MKLDNKNIICSVSAGYSSVMMAIRMKEWYPEHNIINVMANTSKERMESIEFMNECDKYFGLNLVWIEANINKEYRKGTSYNVVNYEDLKLNGEIFEDGIKKYGIPSKINKWCNRELKIVPLTKYYNSLFGSNNYSIAIGIRADEIDRVSSDYKNNNVFYPLLDNKLTTRDRNKFWNDKPIRLRIPAYKGNCDLCFEKSKRKLLTIIKEEPNLVKWWADMTDKYSTKYIDNKPSYNSYSQNKGMNFYRENLSIYELVELSKQPFRSATDEYIYENNLFDAEDECGKSCSPF